MVREERRVTMWRLFTIANLARQFCFGSLWLAACSVSSTTPDACDGGNVPNLKDMLEAEGDASHEGSSTGALMVDTLKGVAKAVYGFDKRALDAESQTSIGNTAQLGLPGSVPVPFPVSGAAPFSGAPLTSFNVLTNILDIRARNERSPELVTISIAPPDVSAVIGVLDIRARLEWGAGGARNVADIDVQNGAVVTLPGTVIRVGGLVTALAGVFPLVGGVQMSATASYGSRPIRRGNTWTAFIPGIIPLASVELRVPFFARAVTVYALEGGPASAPIRIISSSLATNPYLIDQLANVVQTIPLSGQTPNIVISNALAGADVAVTVIFELDI